VAKTEDFNAGKAAVGTGPFKFAEYVPGDRIVMTANEGYWGGKPAWSKVTFKPIQSGPARVAAVLAGDVDVIEDVPTADIGKLSKDGRVSIFQTISNRVIYFHLDHFREISPHITAKDGTPIKNPLRDKRVRLAISKAINRAAIVERVMEGSAIPAGQLLPEKFFGVSKNLKPERYDVEGAKKLLKEAGFEGGFKMKIHGPNGRYVNDAKIAEVVAQMLTRIGIDASVETMPPAVFFRRGSSGGPGNTPEFSFILVVRARAPGRHPRRCARSSTRSTSAGARGRRTAAATPTLRWTSSWMRRWRAWTTRSGPTSWPRRQRCRSAISASSRPTTSSTSGRHAKV
jgi:peptide/nickel transport system substrate-binding protein